MSRSPQLIARLAGLFYLLVFLAAPAGAASATPVRMAVTVVSDAAVALLLYLLLRPVSAWISGWAAVLRLAFAVAMAVDALNLHRRVDLFHSAGSAHAFMTGYLLALLLFGTHCVLVGWLIVRSRYLPWLIGALLMLDGFSQPLNTFANLYAPQLAAATHPYVLTTWAVAEGTLTLWLLLAGVNTVLWRALAAPA